MKHLFRLLKYKLFSNFLSFRLNISYLFFSIYVFSKKKKIHKQKNIETINSLSDLKNLGFTKIYSVFDCEEAKKISENASKLINDKKHISKNNDLSVTIDRPCDNLNLSLEKIFNNKKLKLILENYFFSDYRVKWLDYYRSYPSKNPVQSWLWHFDNYPIGIIKGMILFTDQDNKSGAMSYLDKKRSFSIIKEKYYGLPGNDRKTDISAFLKKNNLSGTPFSLDGKSGDLYLFSGNQMHRANPPKAGFRDVATFMIIPTDKSENFNINYDEVQSEYYFPRNPWAEINKK